MQYRCMRFAANLSMMFTEAPFLDRFAMAADAGFAGVEFLFPYDWAADKVAARARSAGVEIVLFNLPPGDFSGGERGLAALAGQQDEFRRSVATALDYAQALGTTRLHAMAGLVEHGATGECYRVNLRFAADRLAEQGRTLLIEPINPRDMPGYFLSRHDAAMALLDQVAADNLRIQCDLYHLQITAGDLIATLTRDIDRIGHIQIAGVPDRHEPDRGEVHYPAVFDALAALGYDGWIGCEYRPRGDTRAGLAWLAPYL